MIRPDCGTAVCFLFKNLANLNAWSGTFRTAPALLTPADGTCVVEALAQAKDHPVRRELKRKPSRKPASSAMADDVVEVEDSLIAVPDNETASTVGLADSSLHTTVQHTLLRLGATMGFDVHVATNDQTRLHDGRRLGDLPRIRKTLPQQFDPATNKTIALIDVLWLQGEAIVAAFEIETTTAVYSGLLRMSDLLAMQPNITIPLFVVAPEDRRDKVFREVNRPTFKRRSTPLDEVCAYISCENLISEIALAGDNLAYLNARWLDKLSEPCTLESS